MAGDRVLTVRIAGDAKGAVGAIGTVEGATVGLGKKILKIGAMFAGINLGVNLVKDIVDVGKTYNSSLNEMQAVSQATDEQMDKVRETARALGADLTLPSTSAADATQAMLALRKGGLSLSESMDAAKGSIQLAAAAQIDGARAAKIQSDAISAFNLKGKDATMVADTLANVANSATGSIDDVANALSYVGPVAEAADISLTETSTAIGILAQNSIRSQKAGTGLRAILAGIANPSKKAASALKTLNIEAYDQQGNFKGLRYVTKTLSKAKKNLTTQEFAAASAAAFGREPLAAINALAKGGASDWDAMAKSIGREGAAADIAKAKNKGFGGAMDGLESQLEDFYLIVWEKVSPALERMADGAATGLEKLNSFLHDSSGGIKDLSGAINDFDGTAFGEKIADMIESALDKIGSMAGKLTGKVSELIQRVDWVGLGIEAGKAVIPLAVGLATGIINSLTDPAMWAGLAEHWQAILLAVLGIAFAPAKWIAKLATVLRKIPLVGRMLAWLVEGISKIGTKLSGLAGDLWKFFSKGFNKGLGRSGPGVIKSIGRFFKRMAKDIGKWFKDLGGRMANGARDMAERFGNFLARHGPRQAYQALVKIKDKVFRFFGNVGGWLSRHGGWLIGGLIRGVRGAFARITAAVFALKTRVFGFFSSVGSWLYNSGVSLIQGFINGIVAMAGRAKDAAGSVVSGVRNLFPFSPAKEGPFSGRGWVSYSGQAIGTDFAKGMVSRLGMVRKAAEGMAEVARPEVGPLSLPETHSRGASRAYLGTGGRRASRSYLSGPNGRAPVQVNVTVEGNVIGERDFAKRVTPVIRTELIKVGKRNGGSILDK